MHHVQRLSRHARNKQMPLIVAAKKLVGIVNRSPDAVAVSTAPGFNLQEQVPVSRLNINHLDRVHSWLGLHNKHFPLVAHLDINSKARLSSNPEPGGPLSYFFNFQFRTNAPELLCQSI